MAFRTRARYRVTLSIVVLGFLGIGTFSCRHTPSIRTHECSPAGCRSVVEDGVTLPATPDAVVDFARAAAGKFAKNGFLLSLPSIEPRGPRYAAMRAALDVGTWRVGNIRQAEAALSVGARPTLLLYEAWRDQFPRRIPTAWPFDDYVAFEAWLRHLVRANRRLPLTWEVWNEWDLGLPWWGGTEAQLFETYALVNRVVREEVGPSADVAGPSFARFDTLRFRRFADYCVRASCQVNTWTWHELSPGRSAAVAEHARWIRSAFIDDPAYSRLAVRRLDVNEVIAQAERYSPAALVTTLRALHDGGADAFGRSCWRELRSREYECLNASFDGIVDSAAQAPRTTWWVHAAYARIREAPAAATASARLAVLAGRGTGTSVPALILVAPNDASRTDQAVTIELRHLSRSGVVGKGEGGLRVVVRSLPWRSLDAAMDSLPVEWEFIVRPDTDVLRLRLLLPGLGRVPDRSDDPILGRDAVLISVESSAAERRALWPVAARPAATAP